jgi:hypothetical protein
VFPATKKFSRKMTTTITIPSWVSTFTKNHL